MRLYRLAWDVACSGFGGRQELYERYFFGDPIRMMSALYFGYDKAPLKERIKRIPPSGRCAGHARRWPPVSEQIDPREFRRLVGLFATGVTVVTDARR